MAIEVEPTPGFNYSRIWVSEEQRREDEEAENGDAGLLCSLGSSGQWSRRKKKGETGFAG